ncbi:FAD-dependent oxidoreductase [Candidatus Marithrix sp. Canyon 246]|uniref:FAD-dependent oxidoreductase n=2 Tax=Candidatus Marithrix sp. Canyon 246 TaxID=1827136 RepID=UPI000849FA98|nr:FAD-dependent oxidoreductase [Candidatus Marithrix sp. Canyon 246]
MPTIKMNFSDFTFTKMFEPDTLYSIDQQFLNYLKAENPARYIDLLAYRHEQHSFTTVELSELLIDCAKTLEVFLVEFFDISKEMQGSRQQTNVNNPIFYFKKWFVLRRARRRLKKSLENNFTTLTKWLNEQLPVISELTVAQLGQQYLADKETYADDIEKLTQWCVHALTNPDAQAYVQNWVSFRLPQPIDHNKLVSTTEIKHRRQRQDFKLTDQRMSLLQVENEINYCIYCHDRDGDFCSKGFPVKKARYDLGFKTDPLGNTLTGCPLEEKISEMQLLKRDGNTIAALAMVMLDNPMCPVTGHRICNDCMKSCIYQKQEPVNIPQIETRVLTDVLELPWGVEIYDLLTRWNPLRQQQWVAKPYNGLKILIAGLGPAGFTLAHHLLMEGCAVVGIDGLKIEPLPDQFLKHPIRNYSELKAELDNRITTGFGGVAEYGITVRWDKNFLSLIYLTLLRRPYFQVYGGVRFGGTITVEKAWSLGFDHVAIAVGAGLPQALAIPNSLAPGMRQAADFLMSLQLSGAAKADSLANLQVRLPAVVIGGGLTGIDTATEVQAYYLVQIKKIKARYEKLGSKVREHLDAASLEILDEFLSHAKQLESTDDIQGLIHKWGGVTVAYRRSMQESPAYKSNHEEVAKALEEGIFYAESVEPKKVELDKYGHVKALVCQRGDEEIVLAAKAIFVATGAKPNVAYEFEHRGSFEREGLFQYQPYENIDGKLEAVSNIANCKDKQFGPFTSQARVTFIGDTHPAFHGNVVKAVASGKRTYPHIMKSLEHIKPDRFLKPVRFDDLETKIEQIQHHGDNIIELTIRAPLAAQQYKPGQFFRLQNFETYAPIIENTRLQTEPLAMRCAGIDREKGTISLMVMQQGASSRLCSIFRPGDPISLMGPTGTKTNIPNGGETIMIIGNNLAAADIRTVAPALKKAGNKVLYVGNFQHQNEIYRQSELEAATDAIVWITAEGEPIKKNRPQDYSATGELLDVLINSTIALEEVTSVIIVGDYKLIRKIQDARKGILKQYSPKFTASIHGPMQCMLKGVCAQCLQWQIDPKTGERTKAVFSCSWQDQPLDIVDIDNLQERLSQNRLSEQINNLWVESLLTIKG